MHIICTLKFYSSMLVERATTEKSNNLNCILSSVPFLHIRSNYVTHNHALRNHTRDVIRKSIGRHLWTFFNILLELSKQLGPRCPQLPILIIYGSPSSSEERGNWVTILVHPFDCIGRWSITVAENLIYAARSELAALADETLFPMTAHSMRIGHWRWSGSGIYDFGISQRLYCKHLDRGTESRSCYNNRIMISQFCCEFTIHKTKWVITYSAHLKLHRSSA